MKISVLHSISGLNISSGGPSQSAWSLIKGLRNCDINAEILTYKSSNPNERIIGEGTFVHGLSTPKYMRFGYSSAFGNFLKINLFDLYHGHGIWQYPTHAIAGYARNIHKPYIITPRGMLYPEALKKSSLFKKIALPLYQRKDLEKAAVIHATCKQEMVHIRELGFINPVAVIPNGVDIKVLSKFTSLANKKKQVGFIGRLAPIKNIEILLNAWANSGKNNLAWELVIIGDGETIYRNSLIDLAKRLEIKNIRFAGFLTGEEKEIAIQSLNFLVLPSKSENFGMVVPEALIREIPVIASNGTPWVELNTLNAGWWIDIGVQSLTEALNKAINLNETERRQMGQNGRKLVEENYTIEAVAKKMIQLYEWILEGCEKPEFVYLKH